MPLNLKLTRRALAGSFGAVMALSVAGPALAQAKVTLKLGHLGNEENVWHKASVKFAE